MPNVPAFVSSSSIHPGIGAGIGGGTEIPSAGDLLQEDGVSFFVLESGSGIIILQ